MGSSHMLIKFRAQYSMNHLFKDNACDQHINSSYEQLSSERPSALWSLCETNIWFHKCEQTKRSILWDMLQCQIKDWRLMATPVSAFVCVLLSVKPCHNDTPDNMTQQRYKDCLDCINEYIMYNLINRVDRTERQHIQKLCYHQYRDGWYS